MAEAKTMTAGTGANGWVAGLLGWLAPGVGHLWLGQVGRGLVLGGVVWAMYVVGLLMGGHLYSIFSPEAGLLSYVFGFCDTGAGLLYVGSMATGIGVEEQAKLATAEYGNVFLMVAGLLNYLIMLDAFDIGVGRKR